MVWSAVAVLRHAVGLPSGRGRGAGATFTTVGMRPRAALRCPGRIARSRGTRRGRSSGARPARATGTRSAWSGAAGAWWSPSSTYPSSRACRRTGTSRPAAGRAVPAGRERGFEAHDDGTPLVVVDVETEQEFSVAEVVRRHRRHRRRVRRPRGFNIGDEGTPSSSRDHQRRDRPGRGRQPGGRPALPRDRRRLGRRQR